MIQRYAAYVGSSDVYRKCLGAYISTGFGISHHHQTLNSSVEMLSGYNTDRIEEGLQLEAVQDKTGKPVLWVTVTSLRMKRYEMVYT